MRGRRVSARVLAVIAEGQEAAALGSMAALAAVARAGQARVRLAYFRRIPAARVDASDRIRVPAELEMERIEASAVTALGRAARAFDDVVMEPVVRFGRPGREVAIETDVFAADLVVVVTSRDARPLARLRAWALRRRLGKRRTLRLLVVQAPPRARRSSAFDAVPQWWRDMARDPR
jgi:hypothetical protein